MSQPKKRFGRSRVPQEDTRKYSLTDEHRQLAELAAENLPRNRAAEAFAKSAARTGATTAATGQMAASGKVGAGEDAEEPASDPKARKAARRGQRRAARQARAGARSEGARADQPTPLWYKVVMIGLMIVGLLWIIVYYLFQGTLPIPGLNLWNLVLGLAFMLVGLIMTTRWR